MIESRPADGSDPADNYRAIRKEIAEHSAALADKREIIALSKTDLLDDDDAIEAATAEIRADLQLPPDTEIYPISSASRRGLSALLEACWRAVRVG